MVDRRHREVPRSMLRVGRRDRSPPARSSTRSPRHGAQVQPRDRATRARRPARRADGEDPSLGPSVDRVASDRVAVARARRPTELPAIVDQYAYGGAACCAGQATTASSCTPRMATCCSGRFFRRGATSAPTTTPRRKRDGRMRFLLEVLGAIRREVGDDFPIGCRASRAGERAGASRDDRSDYHRADRAAPGPRSGADAFHAAGRRDPTGSPR